MDIKKPAARFLSQVTVMAIATANRQPERVWQLIQDLWQPAEDSQGFIKDGIIHAKQTQNE